MGNINSTQTQLDDLIIESLMLREHLKKLDSRNIEHRHLAIKAIKTYVDQFITPAMYLAYDKDGEKIYYLEVEDVLGEDFDDLGLSCVFSSKKKDFNRPSDEEIEYVFQEISLQHRTPELYEDFWKAWCVQEVGHCVAQLRNFLVEPLTKYEKRPVPADVLRQEIAQIEELRKMPLLNIHSHLNSLLEWEKVGLADWTEETEDSALSEA